MSTQDITAKRLQECLADIAILQVKLETAHDRNRMLGREVATLRQRLAEAQRHLSPPVSGDAGWLECGDEWLRVAT